MKYVEALFTIGLGILLVSGFTEKIIESLYCLSALTLIGLILDKIESLCKKELKESNKKIISIKKEVKTNE